MKDVERCMVCGEVVPEEMQDIAGILSVAENTDKNIKKSTESILRMADRLERRKREEKIDDGERNSGKL